MARARLLQHPDAVKPKRQPVGFLVLVPETEDQQYTDQVEKKPEQEKKERKSKQDNEDKDQVENKPKKEKKEKQQTKAHKDGQQPEAATANREKRKQQVEVKKERKKQKVNPV